MVIVFKSYYYYFFLSVYRYGSRTPLLSPIHMAAIPVGTALLLLFIISGPPPMLAIANLPSQHSDETLVKNPMEEGFLFAVPKHRRSRERRLIRKFGLDNKHKKMLPIRKLLTCDDCGHVHEPGRLCRKC